MYSDRHRRAALLATVLALVACGKQGDPQPRPRSIPRTATDLTVRQRGLDLLFEFSYPTATVAGLPFDGLESATIYEIVYPLAADATIPVLQAADLKVLARPIVELSGDTLVQAIAGSKLRAQTTLPAAALDAAEARFYVARTKAVRGELSDWSNVVGFRLRTSPPAPGGLEVTSRKIGVQVTWTAAPGAVGYVVLRRDSTDPNWGLPLATLGADVTSFADRSALYGSRYVYTVLSLLQPTPPIESAPTSAVEVDYRDLFPPASPTEVKALALADSVRLVWEASPDADLAGYRVERAAGEGEFQALGGGLTTATDLSDESAPRGVELRYRVVAVDRLGNASPPSAEAAALRP